MIEESLLSYLKTQTSFADMIGGASDMRFFPSSTASNPVYPAVVFRKISADRQHDFSGARGSAKSRFQMDVLAQSYSSAKAVSEALRMALDGFTDQEFLSVKLENESDEFDTDTDIRRVSMDFIIYHTENL